MTMWFPHFLPRKDGNRVLMFAVRQGNENQIVLRDLETGEEEVVANGNLPVYSPSGHILYQTSRTAGGIWALPFSIGKLKPTGEAFSIAQNGRNPSVAANGTLVYLDRAGEGGWQLVWLDRGGTKLAGIGQPQELISLPALSPSGGRVAAVGLENGNHDIWVHDVTRPIKNRLTFHEDVDTRPVWSPSEEHVAFSSLREHDWNVFIKGADGSGDVTALAGISSMGLVTDWSQDGRYVLYRRDDTNTRQDLWYLQRKDDKSGYEAVPFLQTSFAERAGKFSPDGRFVAYISDETGRYEVSPDRGV